MVDVINMCLDCKNKKTEFLFDEKIFENSKEGTIWCFCGQQTRFLQSR